MGRGVYVDIYNRNYLLVYIVMIIYVVFDDVEYVVKVLFDVVYINVEGEGLVSIFFVDNFFWINFKFEVLVEDLRLIGG